MIERVDVLVLGLGPAGASAAAEAARRGCSVVALDRKRVPGVPVQCAEFVPGYASKPAPRRVRQRIDAMATFVEDDAADLQPDFPGTHARSRRVRRARWWRRPPRPARIAASARRCERIARDGAVELADGSTLRAARRSSAPTARARARARDRQRERASWWRRARSPCRSSAARRDRHLSVREHPGGYGWLFPKGEVANLGAGVDARAQGATEVDRRAPARRTEGARRAQDPRHHRRRDPGRRHARALGRCSARRWCCSRATRPGSPIR